MRLFIAIILILSLWVVYSKAAIMGRQNMDLPWPTTQRHVCTSPYEYNQEEKTLTLWKIPKECENG